MSKLENDLLDNLKDKKMTDREKDLIGVVNSLLAIRHASRLDSETTAILWQIAEKVLYEKPLDPLEREIVGGSYQMVMKRKREEEQGCKILKFEKAG